MFTFHPTRILALLILVTSAAVYGTDFTPVKLQTEHLENPLAIGIPTPRFSWQLAPTDPSKRNLKQTAYEIQVASSTEKFTESDLWSTGIITHCSVATETRHGKLSCSWKLEGNQFHTEFTIPPNTEAVVTLPIAGPGGQPRRIGSGTYKVSGKYRAR